MQQFQCYISLFLLRGVNVMNVIGIILAIILLMVLVYKRVNLILATLLSALILAMTNNFSFYDLVMEHYSTALGSFIAKYFLVFVTNALFGKVMEETLLVSAFSNMIGRWFGNRNAVYGALLITALLSYGGVSVFVIVFTVYPIFLATFEKADLSRKFISACIMSASCTAPLSMVPGGAQLNNIIPTLYIGTTPMAAPLISIIAALVTVGFIFFYFRLIFKESRIKKEHFDVSEDVKKRIQEFKREPNLPEWMSVLPMVLIVILINKWNLGLSTAVFAGTLLATFIGRKNLFSKLHTFNAGVANVGIASITTAVSVGFGGAVLACAGAQMILQAIISLPVAPVISLGIAASFSGVLTGNGGGGCDVAMNLLSKPYLQLGVPPELLHRIVAIATAGCSCLPHNGMLITVSDTCGFSAKECYPYIFISTVLASMVGLLTVIGLGYLYMV